VDGRRVFSNLHGIALFFFPDAGATVIPPFWGVLSIGEFSAATWHKLTWRTYHGRSCSNSGSLHWCLDVFFHSTCTARLLAYMQYVCNFACMHLLFSIARTLRNSMCLIRGLGWVLKEDWQGFPKCNDQTAEIQTFKSLKWHIPVTLWTVAPQGFAELQYPAGPRRDAWLLVSGGWSFDDGWWICNMTSIIRNLFCLHSLLYSYMLCYLGAVPSSWLTFHDTKNWCTKECGRVLQWMEADFKKETNHENMVFPFPIPSMYGILYMYIYHKHQPFM